MRLKLYLIYWFKSSGLTLQSLITTRLSSILFMIGKIGRFALFIGFLLALKRSITDLFGYSFDQLVVFFLIFNLFDLIGQLFYRGTYWFRDEIVSGDFDFRLTKPLNPLFQILTSHTDFLDLPLLLIVLVMLVIYWPRVDAWAILGFIYFSVLSLIILTAVHILVSALGVVTTAVEHTIWTFRDISQMARVPVDIYAGGVRVFLTYVIPVAMIFTVPAKTLFGLVSSGFFLVGLIFAVGFYLLSLKLWGYALRRYASASS